MQTASSLLCLVWATALAQADEPPQGDARRDLVAATVNGRPVLVHEVQRELARVLGDRGIEPEAEAYLRAKTLQQLIERQLILQWLEQHGQAASDEEIQLALSRFEKQLSQREMTLETYLERRRMRPGELQGALKWQLSWQRFLDRFLTDQNLERYFRDHQRQFDGTELRVAHILLRVDTEGDAESLVEQLVAAKRVREEIMADQLSFAEAAKQYSDAPTGETGGGIGFIARHQPMPEAFSSAAFELEPGEVSEPVISAFGVHLIQCLEIKPGQKRWQEVRSQLEQAVTRYLFEWAGGQGAAGAEIEFTGAVPHFKPGTEEIE